MNTNDLDFSDDDAPEGSFLKRNWLALTVAAGVLAGGTSAAIALSSKGNTAPRKADVMTVVSITPPPPALPPPPPPPQQMEDNEIKPDEEQEEQPQPEDAGPSTNNVGSGAPDAFKLNAGKGKRGAVVLRPVSPRSLWTRYANGAASRIADAMRRHGKLKHSSLTVMAHVWIDSTGRIIRATTDATGDAALDAALRNEVLQGMQLPGPPPEGMVMPVNLKLSARRPG